MPREVGVVVLSTVPSGLGGDVSTPGLRPHASRLEMPLPEAAPTHARDADDRREEGAAIR